MPDDLIPLTGPYVGIAFIYNKDKDGYDPRLAAAGEVVSAVEGTPHLVPRHMVLSALANALRWRESFDQAIANMERLIKKEG